MVELHSKVAHILKIPAIKQTATSNGTLRVCAQIRLLQMIAIQQASNVGFEAKRNFNRNMTVKVKAIPTMEA